MGSASELPSTETLKAMHPLSAEGMEKVYKTRAETADALEFGHKLVAIVGPCAMTDDMEAILDENRRMSEFARQNNIVLLHRLPPWKPRTNPADWHGLETTNPQEAHRITVAIAEQSGNLAMEFGCSRHIKRYIAQTALGWRGSRNNNEERLLAELIHGDASLPVAIKNGMDGSTRVASSEAIMASIARQNFSEEKAAPVSVIFRGGIDLQTPDDWMDGYMSAFNTTGGHFIVDVAHGGEQAHDPNGSFAKSAMGQIACMHSIQAAAKFAGMIPRGVMIEASDLPSPTDPVVPLDEALEELQRLNSIFMRRQNGSRR